MNASFSVPSISLSILPLDVTFSHVSNASNYAKQTKWCLRLLGVGIFLRRIPKLISRAVCVEFVVEKLHWTRFFFLFIVIRFYCVSFHSSKAYCSIIHVLSEDVRTCVRSVPLTISLNKSYINGNGSDSYEPIRTTFKRKAQHFIIFYLYFFFRD